MIVLTEKHLVKPSFTNWPRLIACWQPKLLVSHPVQISPFPCFLATSCKAAYTKLVLSWHPFLISKHLIKPTLVIGLFLSFLDKKCSFWLGHIYLVNGCSPIFSSQEKHIPCQATPNISIHWQVKHDKPSFVNLSFSILSWQKKIILSSLVMYCS